MAAETSATSRPPAESATASEAHIINRHIAEKLRDYANLLVSQGEGGFRSRAYHRAADVLAVLDQPANEILASEGRAGLIALPTIGVAIACAATGHNWKDCAVTLRRKRCSGRFRGLARNWQPASPRKGSLKASRIWKMQYISAICPSKASVLAAGT